MKKTVTPLLFGLVLILVGLGYLGSTFLGWNFNLFFDGWWTLFIIIPTFASIVAHGPSVGNVTGCLIGVLLLLKAQNVIRYWSHFGICAVSLVVIAIGVSLIIGFFQKGKPVTYAGYNSYAGPPPGENGQQPGNQAGPPPPPPNGRYWQHDPSDCPSYNGILSGVTTKCVSRNFKGARASAVMGGVDIDMRDVVIREDVTVYATAIMGGIDIYAPKNVRIAIQKTDILGGTDCRAFTLGPESGAPVCTFVCTCVMGGIDIK